MPIEFENITVSNSTQCTLSLSPWDCDCVLPPGGSTFGVNCVSDGVLDQNTGLSYVWVNNTQIQMPQFAVFIACTPVLVTLAVYSPGQEADAAIHFDATPSSDKPPAKRSAPDSPPPSSTTVDE